MNSEVIETLTEKACASIRFRIKKEILGESPDIDDYLDEILDDKRVQYAFSWQKEDGFLGNYFHYIEYYFLFNISMQIGKVYNLCS